MKLSFKGKHRVRESCSELRIGHADCTPFTFDAYEKKEMTELSAAPSSNDLDVNGNQR